MGKTDKLFKRRNGESNEEFQSRIKKGSDDDKLLGDVNAKICYFGNGENLTDEITKEWPQNSLIISKNDPQCPSNVIWSTDPYAVFN